MELAERKIVMNKISEENLKIRNDAANARARENKYVKIDEFRAPLFDFSSCVSLLCSCSRTFFSGAHIHIWMYKNCMKQKGVCWFHFLTQFKIKPCENGMECQIPRAILTHVCRTMLNIEQEQRTNLVRLWQVENVESVVAQMCP